MKPLSGKRVLITRPARQAASFCHMIEQAGGTAIAVPLIAFREAEGEPVRSFDRYDWIVVTSKNGMDFLMKRVGDPARLAHVKWAAIGSKTAEAIESYGFAVSYKPAAYTADQLVEEIRAGLFLPERALLPKGNLARDIIGKAIRAQGKQADDWIVYETFFPEEQRDQLIQAVQTGNIEMYTFTSPSAVRHFYEALQAADVPIPAADYAVIGPVTEKEMRVYGLPVHVRAEPYTTKALCEAIVTYYKE